MTRNMDPVLTAKLVIKVTGTLPKSHGDPKSIITATPIDLLEYYLNEKDTCVNGEKT